MGNDELLTVKQVQDILKVSERTVFNLISRKELTGFKVGRSWRFRIEDINAYEDRQRAAVQEQISKKQSENAA